MISDLRDFCDACNKMQQVVQGPLAAQATGLFPGQNPWCFAVQAAGVAQ